MIDRALIKRLFGFAGILLLFFIGVTVIADSPKMAGGLVVGFALGAFPFLSWASLLSARIPRIRHVLLLVLKLLIYGSVLYLSVTQKWVSPIGVFVGMTAAIFAATLGTIAATARRTKEAA